MGRPRKSIIDHKRDGTYQKSRHAGPEPETVKPEMPAGMEGAAASLWQELTPVLESMGIYTAADSLALRLMCDSYALYVEASDYIQEHGSYYVSHVKRDGTEIYKEHPAAKAVSRYRREIIDIGRQFGLTPASRTGLNVGKPAGNELSELDKILRGGRN